MAGVPLCPDNTGSTHLEHFAGDRDLIVGPRHHHHGGIQGFALPDDLFDVRPNHAWYAGGLQDDLGSHALGNIQHRFGHIYFHWVEDMGGPHFEGHFSTGFGWFRQDYRRGAGALQYRTGRRPNWAASQNDHILSWSNPTAALMHRVVSH